jgi:ketosteroid isomerase-like protein
MRGSVGQRNLQMSQRVLSVVVLLATACSGPPAVDAGQVSASISEKDAQLARWYAGGLADSAAMVFAEDCWFLRSNAQPLIGRDAYQAFWIEAFGWGNWRLSFDLEDLVVADSTAVERGRYTLTFAAGPASPIASAADSGDYLARWKLEPDGEWRIVWHASASALLLTDRRDTAATGSLRAFVLDQYTSIDSSDDYACQENRVPRNRFRALPQGSANDLQPPPDCWPFALDDGLHCFRFTETPVPFQSDTSRQDEFEKVTRIALDSSTADISDLLVFTESVHGGGFDCASFYLRRVALTAASMTMDDAYFADRDYGSGFACSGNGVKIHQWERYVADYNSERYYRVWDAFSHDEHAYLLVAVQSCAAECEWFEVYEIVDGAARLVESIFLWSL